MTAIKYLIGLDVSIQTGNNGFVIYDCKAKQFVSIRSMGYKSLAGEISDFLNEYCTKHDNGDWADVAVVLENADLDSPVFGAWIEFQKQLKFQFKSNFPNWNSLNFSSFSSMMMQAQNIGMQKMVARDVLHGLQMLKVKIIQIAPSWRERADVMKNKGGLATMDITYYRMPTKTNKEQFERLTGYKGITNEHERDAATLVWNQTYERLKVWSDTKMLEVNVKKEKKAAKKKVGACIKKFKNIKK